MCVCVHVFVLICVWLSMKHIIEGRFRLFASGILVFYSTKVDPARLSMLYIYFTDDN